MPAHKSPSAAGSEFPDPVADTPATWWLTGVSFAVAGAAVASVVFLGGNGANGASAAPEASADHPDAEQVGSLLAHTRTAHEGLVPVVEDMEEFLPTDGSHPPLELTEASVVNSWRTEVQDASVHFGEVPESGGAHRTAHAGLVSSVRLLSMSVDTYAKAALVQDEDLRMDVLHIAMELRDQAVVSWSVAATHLDAVSVDTGHGHVHLYLPAAPDSGALTPDGAEEGAGPEDAGEGSGGGHDH